MALRKIISQRDFNNGFALRFWHLHFLSHMLNATSHCQQYSGNEFFYWEKFVSTASSHNWCASHSVCSLSLSSLCHARLHYVAKKHMAMCWHSNYKHFHPIFYFRSHLFFCVDLTILVVSECYIIIFTQFANSSNIWL